jgi:hypothetical protein
MKNLFLSVLLVASLSLTLSAENNSTKTAPKSDNNSSIDTKQIEKKVQEQIEREKKYAKEKVFYQGDDYNLSEAEVDQDSLSSIPVLEPEYDFDMDDVYSD